MKKAGILTFLHNDNYGSTLQAYALERTVRDLGWEGVHLNYSPDTREKTLNLLKSGNHPKLLLEGIRKRRVKTRQGAAREKTEAIGQFYERRMHLTPVCRNQQELRERSRDCGLLICGSDQIWNPVWMNPAYFLSFAEPGQKKVAYAPSLGVSTAPGKRKGDMIRRLTADFAAVSVREWEGADILEQVTGKRPMIMPDPVCLLSAEDWKELAAGQDQRDPYMLCYLIGEKPDYPREIVAAERETGLKPLVLPVTAQAYALGLNLTPKIGPEAFLGAIRDAALVLTDSFHGLVFATLFGVPVRLLRRYSDRDPENKNSRIDHFQRLMETGEISSLREAGRTWLGETLRRCE